MTKFFATADVNGLISHELNASAFIEARRELEESVGSGEARRWIDDAETELESELDIDCSGDSYNDALEAASEAGAVCKLAAVSNDQWEIYAVESDD